MPVAGKTIAFTKANIEKSPDQPGVYALLVGEGVIYYGRSETSIRSRLLRHFNGVEGKCTQAADHYKREVTFKPKTREAELLSQFKVRYGKYPRCNERSA